MPKPPPKHKPEQDWTPAEILDHQRSGRKPFTDEWKSYITDVAQAAGVEPADLGAEIPADAEALTPADHYREIRRG